jgi:hypothetical protein
VLIAVTMFSACAKNQSLGGQKNRGEDAREQEVMPDTPSERSMSMDGKGDATAADVSLANTTPDDTASVDQDNDGAAADADAAPSIVPQCLGRQGGGRFCMGSQVYQCDPDLTGVTLYATCIAPNATCVNGECGKCAPNAKRSCSEDGLVGPCAEGTETCIGTGTWGACSIPAGTTDTCEAGNDNNCNGKPNENCVPQCMGRQVGDKFCIGADVFQCGPNLMSTTLVATCVAPKPACMSGACGTCLPNATRSCSDDGLRGPCAAGTETCSGAGTWGACSISPGTGDTCDRGNDNNCNGKLNENCACINGEQKTCAVALSKKGACGLDTATCLNGQWTGCTDTKGTDTCVRGNDNSCNDKPNENCVCINGDTGKCGDKLGAKGPCAGGTTTCASGQWGECDRQPKAADVCVFGNDDMCTGVPVGSPANTQCQCGGFTMPNPASAGLPNPASYKDNGDGTVTDKVTGLLWERSVSASFPQSDAAIHCSSRGPGWRVPTLVELVSLVDVTVYPGPTINQVFPGTPAEVFWTSSPFVGGPTGLTSTWYVNFLVGDTGTGNAVVGTSRIRCVSAAGVVPKCYSRRYQPNGAGEIFDSATGLTWQQNLDGNTFSWSDAKAHCTAGWRAPSLTELLTIVDITRSNPAIDPSAFPGTPSLRFWTSAPSAGSEDNAWCVSFGNGIADDDSDHCDKANRFPVRCVR